MIHSNRIPQFSLIHNTRVGVTFQTVPCCQHTSAAQTWDLLMVLIIEHITVQEDSNTNLEIHNPQIHLLSAAAAKN